MTDDILVVTFTATNHILGALTRSGGPPAKVTPQDVVGDDGLVLRLAGTPALSVTVDPGQLSVTSIAASNEALLLRPTSYVLSGTPPQAYEKLDTSTEPTVTFDSPTGTVTVTVVHAATGDRDLFLLIGKTPIPMKLPATAFSVGAAASPPSGDNAYLLLFPNYQGMFGTITVP